MNTPHESGLQLFDWLLIALYAALTVTIGWYFGRRQRSTEEYFVGSGNMNFVLIGVSLFATLLSTISYLSKPGEALGKGPVLMASQMLAYPLIYIIVGYGLLPVFMKHRVTSAYELLEQRLGLSVRLLGATMFVVLRLTWMSLLVFLAAKAMTVMLGVADKWIPLIVLVTGLVAVIYTSIGGLRAVVVTDFIQTVLLLGGALLVIVLVTVEMGGFGWFPRQWHTQWDVQPVMSFDLKTRMTFVGGMLMYTTWFVCTAGGDQTVVQRFMATRDASAARSAVATQLLVGAAVSVTLTLVGFSLLGYFEANPGQLPAGMDLKDDADKIFPRYIAFHLPVGIAGLVVSAMFAAAMSSIDSGVNSITAVVMTDYLDRFGKRPQSERGHVLAAKALAFTIGAIVVVGSSFMEHVPGNFTAMTSKVVNLLTTPIFGLFFFALFVPFAHPMGVWAGALCGTVVAVATAFSGPLVTWLELQWGIEAANFGVEIQLAMDPVTGKQEYVTQDPVSFQWIGPLALAANLAVGTSISWVMSRGRVHED